MKKINNKVLVIGLVALVAIFVLSRVFRSPKLEGNLRKELVSIDTAKVSEFRIARSQSNAIRISKEAGKWYVHDANKKFAADRDVVKSVITTVSTLRAQRMVSRKEDKWESYQVDDKGMTVLVYYGKDVETEFKVGKTGFNQSAGNSQFGGGQNFQPFTYVRMSGENEVYIVDGFLESTFNRPVNEWRDRRFLRVSQDLVRRIAFNYPDSSFVVEKKDSVWTVGSRQVEEASVKPYLRTLSSKNIEAFVDDAPPSGSPDFSIQISGEKDELAKVEAWKTESRWVLRSSLQPDVYFEGTEPNGVADVFVGQARFK